MFYVELAAHQFNRLNLLILLLSLTCITSCKSEDQEPELHDQVYQQLLKEKKDSEKDLEEAQKSREETLRDMASTKLDHLDMIRLQKQLKKIDIAIAKITQQSRYLKIKADRRRVESRKAYKVAFLADKDWNTKKDYESYETHRRLLAVDLNWDKRVPKLFQNSPNFQPKKKEQAKKKEE